MLSQLEASIQQAGRRVTCWQRIGADLDRLRRQLPEPIGIARSVGAHSGEVGRDGVGCVPVEVALAMSQRSVVRESAWRIHRGLLPPKAGSRSPDTTIVPRVTGCGRYKG